MKLRRLLSISHSYGVALNRRLAHEMAVQSAGRWSVTAVAPSAFPGDLRDITLEPIPGEASHAVGVPVRFARRIHAMLYGRALRDVMRESWDLVHCWEEPYIAAATQIAWLAPANVPLVYATFQNIAKRYPPPFSWMEHYAMRRAHGWIAFGQTASDALHDRAGYRDRPHRVIPTGVDTMVFRPDDAARAATRESLGWSDDGAPVVGFLGRFTSAKGIPMLLRAIDRLRVRCRVLFVGGGPLENELRGWAARRGANARVVTGVAHDRVPTFLNAMDVLCAPSQTTPRWREQLGRMLLEALACGIPIVASRSGEIPNVVGNAGMLLDEQDENAWVTALDALLDDPSRRAELSAAGRARAVDEFAWDVVARKHLAFFDELTQMPR